MVTFPASLTEDKHFQPAHFMTAGRRLLEALIVYCKVQVHPDDKKKSQKQIANDLKSSQGQPAKK